MRIKYSAYALALTLSACSVVDSSSLNAQSTQQYTAVVQKSTIC